MNENVHENAYRLVLNEACSELSKISQTFEQLCAEKYRLERLIEVLKPHVEQSGKVARGKHIKRAVHLPRCIVVTRLTVL